jgi:hypothetical protein
MAAVIGASIAMLHPFEALDVSALSRAWRRIQLGHGQHSRRRRTLPAPAWLLFLASVRDRDVRHPSTHVDRDDDQW